MRRAIATLLLAMAAATAAAGEPVMPPIVILDAPSNLGLRPPAPGVEPGVRKLPQALRALDIVARLQARDGGSVAAPPYAPDADPAVGFRNGSKLAMYSRELAARVGERMDRGEFVLLLGGDCSVLLGPALALKRRGRYGLAFIDAHDDYTYPRDRKRYAGIMTAAGLDLGLATGHGPAALTDIDGHGPYVAESDVVHLGLAREDADFAYGRVAAFTRSAIHKIPRGAIRARGAEAAAREARTRLEATDLAGFWIHIDADVLAREVMPAVDSPSADGLSLAELTAILTELLRSPRAAGLELTILDPDLDPTGAYARTFADAVVAAFVASGRAQR